MLKLLNVTIGEYDTTVFGIGHPVRERAGVRGGDVGRDGEAVLVVGRRARYLQHPRHAAIRFHRRSTTQLRLHIRR